MRKKIIRLSYVSPLGNKIEMLAIKTLIGYRQILLEEEIILEKENKLLKTEEIGEIEI